jgi:hypothetical protein
MTWTDADGAQLTGEHSYTMSPPPPRPADPARSITMHDLRNSRLVANPIDRYPVGDRTRYRRGAASSPSRPPDRHCRSG